MDKYYIFLHKNAIHILHKSHANFSVFLHILKQILHNFGICAYLSMQDKKYTGKRLPAGIKHTLFSE